MGSSSVKLSVFLVSGFHPLENSDQLFVCDALKMKVCILLYESWVENNSYKL